MHFLHICRENSKSIVGIFVLAKRLPTSATLNVTLSVCNQFPQFTCFPEQPLSRVRNKKNRPNWTYFAEGVIVEIDLLP